MKDFYQQIGSEITKVTEGCELKALLYSEVEDGAISADIFYLSNEQQAVSFRFSPKDLQEIIYKFWEAGEENVAPCSWVAMSFIVEKGKFSVDLKYPDQLNIHEDLSDRRPQVVADHFPGLKVDYSKPNG